jgi:uncharacterized protein (UPF0305 family)
MGSFFHDMLNEEYGDSIGIEPSDDTEQVDYYEEILEMLDFMDDDGIEYVHSYLLDLLQDMDDDNDDDFDYEELTESEIMEKKKQIFKKFRGAEKLKQRLAQKKRKKTTSFKKYIKQKKIKTKGKTCPKGKSLHKVGNNYICKPTIKTIKR